MLLNLIGFNGTIIFVLSVNTEYSTKVLNYLYITIPIMIINNKENNPPAIDGIVSSLFT